MKKIVLFLLTLMVGAASLAYAEDVSLISPKRLSLGLRAFTQFEQGYVNQQMAGVSASYIITSVNDPVKYPLSIIGSVDYDFTEGKPQYRLGVGLLLKKAGQ